MEKRHNDDDLYRLVLHNKSIHRKKRKKVNEFVVSNNTSIRRHDSFGVFFLSVVSLVNEIRLYFILSQSSQNNTHYFHKQYSSVVSSNSSESEMTHRNDC